MNFNHTHSALDVASSLLKHASLLGKEITYTKLQNLIYISHGLSLCFLDRPLVIENILALKTGPTIPLVHSHFKHYKSEVITEQTYFLLDNESEAIVESAIDIFGDLTEKQFYNLIHKNNSPWNKVYDRISLKIIPDTIIQEHYINIAKTGITNCL